MHGLALNISTDFRLRWSHLQAAPGFEHYLAVEQVASLVVRLGSCVFLFGNVGLMPEPKVPDTRLQKTLWDFSDFPEGHEDPDVSACCRVLELGLLCYCSPT